MMNNPNQTERMQTTSSQALDDIDEIPPISKEDEVCLKEVRDVLTRHGKVSRFGITLIHQHFPLAEDEILLERCDPQSRTLTIRPAKKNEIKDSLETSWRLDTPGVLLACEKMCDKNHHFCHSPSDAEDYVIGEGW